MAAFVYPAMAGLMMLAQVGGVSFQGRRATASDTDGRAFMMTGSDPTVDQWEPTIGHANLDVEDRVQQPNATYGDRGTLQATLTSPAGDTWTIELDRPGFPVRASGQASMLRGWLRFPFGGGVLTDADLQGPTGIGLLRGPRVHAAAAVWGEGTVRLNGAVVTDHALIECEALSAGSHADDPSFRTLPQARAGDAEIVVFVSNLPTDAVPQGFLLFGFDDVQISLAGQAVASEITVPNSGVPGPAPLLPQGAGATTMLGVGGSGGVATTPSLPTPTTGTATPPGAVGGTGFSSTGIPATPPVANASPAAALPATPTPANASPATPLPTTPTPANSAPATPLPATPTPVGTATGTTATAPAGTGIPGAATPGPAAPGTGTTGTATPGTGPTGTGTGTPMGGGR